MKTSNTMSRLESVSRSLAASLRQVSDRQQRAACLAACEFAVEHSGVDSPVVEHALQALRQSKPVAPQVKRDLEALTQRLDDEYFDLQEAAENGTASEDEWKRAFSQARAASALVFASGDDAFEAASQAIYEATATVDDNSELVVIVAKAMA
ncbi:MAG: hypothetical protein ACKO2L_11390 [Planctomycetaceae bacterium]